MELPRNEPPAQVRKRFWEDPYRHELDTVVTWVDGRALTLAETIFYAQSGGQESDAGSIAGLPVEAARKQGAQIVYTLPAGHGLAAGDAVHVTIDWPRRYRLMRLHFAAEVVLELVYLRLGRPAKIGAHIAEDKARLDFEWAGSIAGHFPLLLGAVEALVRADQPIVSAFSDEAAGRRYWEVAGFARVACGGTHPRRTGEIGALALKRRNIGRGKERIEITLA